MTHEVSRRQVRPPAARGRSAQQGGSVRSLADHIRLISLRGLVHAVPTLSLSPGLTSAHRALATAAAFNVRIARDGRPPFPDTITVLRAGVRSRSRPRPPPR